MIREAIGYNPPEAGVLLRPRSVSRMLFVADAERKIPQQFDLLAGRVSYDQATKTVTSGEVNVKLTLMEHRLLMALYRHKEHVVSRNELTQIVWGNVSGNEGRFRGTIERLRRKIEPVRGQENIIHAEKERGYWLGDLENLETTPLQIHDTGLAYYPGIRRLRVGERLESLLDPEHRLLMFFQKAPNTLIPGGLLKEEIGRGEISDITLGTHLRNLRIKIGDDPQNPQIIKTQQGFGFYLGDLDPSRYYDIKEKRVRKAEGKKLAEGVVYYAENRIIVSNDKIYFLSKSQKYFLDSLMKRKNVLTPLSALAQDNSVSKYQIERHIEFFRPIFGESLAVERSIMLSIPE